MWSFGYTTWVAEDTYPDAPYVQNDVFWGNASTFADAVRELYDNVLKLAAECEEYQNAHYEQVMEDISETMNNSDIMDDPDQWEDMEFTDNIGEITYYVTFED